MPSTIVSLQSSIVLVLFCTAAWAQPCPPIEVRNPDGNYIVPGSLGDIPYASQGALDAYVQPGNRAAPAVIVIHGGGWTSGSRAAHVGQILELLTRGGYHWFSLDFRAAGLPAYEESLADLRSALAFIRCRAPEFGVDPNALVLLGEDSGAHLAALLAAEKPTGVIGAVLIGGFYELPPPAAAPMGRIQAGMPAMLVIHGGGDTDTPIDDARRYCSKVSEAGNRCQLFESPRASHRVENWWPAQWQYKQTLLDWLATLRPRTARPTTLRSSNGVRKDVLYAADPPLKLDAFVPPSSKPVPAVVIVHGGGWEAGDKVTYVTPLFEPLARAGLAWFSIDYRLTPDVVNDDQIDDVRKAVRFVRAEHRRFNIDPDRIVLLGESASGQLVLQVAAEDPALAGVVSFYGVYDFNAMVSDASPRSLLVRLFRRQVLDDDARVILRRYSPMHTARKGMPPVLLVNGTGERLWEQARAFDRRLTEIGVRHDLVALEKAPHGLENWEGHPEWMFYKHRLVDWIRAAVR